jgi:hypothetical protein
VSGYSEIEAKDRSSCEKKKNQTNLGREDGKDLSIHENQWRLSHEVRRDDPCEGVERVEV